MGPLDKFKQIRVLIGIPSQGVWYADFGVSLCNMITACNHFRIGEFKSQEILTTSIRGSVLSKSRRLVVEEAKNREVDYLLWVDTDQTFPRKTLHLLISRNKDAIGANVATKQIPASWTARKKAPEGQDTPWGGLPVYTDEESKGIEKVWRLGTGILLLSRKALDALDAHAFDVKYRDDVKETQGEDWEMCTQLEKAGIDIWVDHDLSKEVGHIGHFTYTGDVVGELARMELPVEEQPVCG